MQPNPHFRKLIYRPELGCGLVVVTLIVLLLLPFLFLDLMQSALQKLHLGATFSLLVIVSIFLGGFVNIPLHRIERQVEQLIPISRIRAWMGWVPMGRKRNETILAVNVGGCLIPLALVIYQLFYIVPGPSWAIKAMIIAVAVNVAVCWWVARPVPGVGIVMPALTSPLVCVLAAWILLPDASFAPIRASVAFTAGVLGPLIGADLLHLRDMKQVSASVLSIGGAGTFDGIVLSGLLAALLA